MQKLILEIVKNFTMFFGKLNADKVKFTQSESNIIIDVKLVNNSITINEFEGLVKTCEKLGLEANLTRLQENNLSIEFSTL